MKHVCAAAILLLTCLCANAQSVTPMPMPGKPGKFDGPALALPEAGGLSGQRAAAALAALPKNGGETTRGGAEAALYRKLAPSVVLIVTDDGLGSGSFITKDGEIITCYHVVGKNKTVGIIMKPLKGGQDDKVDPSQVLVADVLRYDGVADLALLKLRLPPGATVTPIPLGDLSKVSIGDDVSAIGHPIGETWTYTKGLVSQIRRDFEFASEGVQNKMDMIQTQTPINPGNSGGPLLNAAGQLIGVNEMVVQGAQGINYSVAVDEVQKFLAATGNREPIPAPKDNSPKEAQSATTDGDKPKAKSEPSVATTCKVQLVFEGRDERNTGALRRYDTQCHGQVDLAIFLPDDKTKPMIAEFAGKSGKIVGEAYSVKRDGYWNISYWDSKDSGTQKWDTVGYHPDGKLIPSSYGPYIPKSAD